MPKNLTSRLDLPKSYDWFYTSCGVDRQMHAPDLTQNWERAFMSDTRAGRGEYKGWRICLGAEYVASFTSQLRFLSITVCCLRGLS